jgi:hypothetical protein
MADVVNDVYDFLLAQSIAGGASGWDLHRRHIADSPAADRLVVVTEDGGAPPEIKDTAGIGDSAMHDVGVLVTVRADAWNGDASKAKAQEIIAALHGKRSIVVGDTTYMRVRARTPEPVFAGFDEHGKPRHTVGLMLLYAV